MFESEFSLTESLKEAEIECIDYIENMPHEKQLDYPSKRGADEAAFEMLNQLDAGCYLLREMGSEFELVGIEVDEEAYKNGGTNSFYGNSHAMPEGTHAVAVKGYSEGGLDVKTSDLDQLWDTVLEQNGVDPSEGPESLEEQLSTLIEGPPAPEEAY